MIRHLIHNLARTHGRTSSHSPPLHPIFNVSTTNLKANASSCNKNNSLPPLENKNWFHPSSKPIPLSSSSPTAMLGTANSVLLRLCSHLSWDRSSDNRSREQVVSKRDVVNEEYCLVPASIRMATFNAAMFSMAPAGRPVDHSPSDLDALANDRPRGILKQLSSHGKPKRKVSINLPDNEISAANRGKAPLRCPSSRQWDPDTVAVPNRTVMDVLTEVGADVVALQNVKAVEEDGMRPLSELAQGLCMKFVFAESWAPEYGNAILSRWPIKRCRVQRIFDDSDFRNVLKATIEVPRVGEVNFHCTHLDHLDESWRMKQMSKILQSTDGPHILAGGLNSLDETDYSPDRWADIVKYYEEIGKPTPKAEVMKFLRERRYVDAKGFAGECEAVVVVAKGQDVQGTCKYGTRVDYILASPSSPYKFVPGSYMVVSSKGTSDHHIVRVDVKVPSAVRRKHEVVSRRRS